VSGGERRWAAVARARAKKIWLTAPGRSHSQTGRRKKTVAAGVRRGCKHDKNRARDNVQYKSAIATDKSHDPRSRPRGIWRWHDGGVPDASGPLAVARGSRFASGTSAAIRVHVQPVRRKVAGNDNGDGNRISRVPRVWSRLAGAHLLFTQTYARATRAETAGAMFVCLLFERNFVRRGAYF